ncbi:YhgE/Pip family protein [Microbacterium sp. RD1]|uniref:YhgE/Pip family protein n=1 Tax=Microbacterium sp. RD1 TaxID=3457313 RepID=UPI003FA5722E
MTALLERAGTRRPITWLTIVGALLLPVILGGVLVTALYNPVERLDAMTAAVVNDDEPVELDGQTVPLGRQLTAGLVEGSDELPSNLTWTITNDEDAAAGLADGSYDAVIMIPENFSAAATSTAPGGSPEQATIRVTTPPDSLVVDDAISAQVTSAAASLLGTSLSEVYLENVFVGFSTLGDQLGTAADGAAQLADGARQAADGAGQLPSGAAQLADGAGQLSSGAGELATGLDRIAGGIGQSASGAGQLATGASAGAAQLRASGLVPAELTAAAGQAATAAAGAASGVDALVGQLTALQAAACETPGPVCDQASVALATATGTQPAAAGAAQATAGVGAGLGQFAAAAPEQIAGQLDSVAAGAGALQGGLDQLSAGATQSAAGARALSSGAGQLSSGAGELATGAQSLADGVGRVADGTGELATGLQTAVDEIPAYSEDEAQSLASVVADPVAAEGVETNLFGASAVPLLVTVALWFGGLGTFVALRAVTARTLASRRPSAMLALRGLLPAAGIGAAQGLLVAAVVQLAASYGWAEWSAFALASVAAGIAFAAVNQALVAVFGGAGRWISAVIGVLAVATGVVSTVPGVLSAVAGLLPTSPAYNGMLAGLTAGDGLGSALVGLAVWAVLSFVATTVAVARRRSVSPRALLAT